MTFSLAIGLPSLFLSKTLNSSVEFWVNTVLPLTTNNEFFLSTTVQYALPLLGAYLESPLNE